MSHKRVKLDAKDISNGNQEEDFDAMQRKYPCDVISFREWLNNNNNTNHDHNDDDKCRICNPLSLIDLRSESEFYSRRIRTVSLDCIIVNLPFETLVSGERSCELPPRNMPFAVMLSSKSRFSVKDVHQFFFSTTSKSTGQSRVPWMLKQIIVADEDEKDGNVFWEELKAMKLLEEGDNNVSLPLRLWKPDPLVQDVLLPILIEYVREWSKKQDSEHKSSIIGEVWDLGSGAGRDVCFLAEEVQYFCRNELKLDQCPLLFVGIDNHKGSAKRCQPLWEHRGVATITESRLTNLKKVDLIEASLDKLLSQQRQLVLCYAVRFLNRPLLEYIAENKHIIMNGMTFAISHFCMKEDGIWEFDHPKAQSVLKFDELSHIFSDNFSWNSTHHELALDADAGRTMIKYTTKKSYDISNYLV